MRKSIKIFLSISILSIFVLTSLVAQGYHVCVASYKSLKNAEEMVQSLEKQSIAAFVSESKVKNQSYYRVLLSKEFKKIDEARKYRDEVKKYSFVRELGLKDFWVCEGERLTVKNSSAKPQEKPQEKVSSKPAKKTKPASFVKKEENPAPIPEPVVHEPKPEEKKQLELPKEPEVITLKESEPVLKEPEVILQKETEPVLKEPEVFTQEEPEVKETLPIPEEPEVTEEVKEEGQEEKTEKPVLIIKAPVEDVEVESKPEEIKPLNRNENAVLSRENPYSVLVRAYKFEQFAKNDKKRLEELGFDAYLVNTFDEKSLFAFNIHAGAFSTVEEAEQLKQQFTDAGITDTEISNYLEIESKIAEYDKVIATEKVNFDDGLTELPTSIPSAVEKVIKHFPANKDFPIQRITIVDYNAYLSSAYKPSVSSPVFSYIAGESTVQAASEAVYRDELYGKEVSVFFANAENFPIDDALGEVEEILFESKDGVFECQLYESGDELIVCGKNEEENLFVRIRTSDFERQEFIDFLIDSFNGKSLEIYPQLRRTLFVLPDENPEILREFVCFNYEKIGKEYAAERDNVDWALSIVGHSLAKSYYNENASLVSIGIYDLDYDFNAKKVHEHFVDSKNIDENADSNQIVQVNDVEGWFLLNPSQKEISFSTKSYVIAVDTEPNSYLLREDLVNIGTDLKLWD